MQNLNPRLLTCSESVEPLSRNCHTHLTQNKHVYAICCRPKAAGDVVSGENVKIIERYAVLYFKVASFMTFRDTKKITPWRRRRRTSTKALSENAFALRLKTSPIFFTREIWGRLWHCMRFNANKVAGCSAIFRTSINTDWRKQLVMSYPVRLQTMSARMSMQAMVIPG